MDRAVLSRCSRQTTKETELVPNSHLTFPSYNETPYPSHHRNQTECLRPKFLKRAVGDEHKDLVERNGADDVAYHRERVEDAEESAFAHLRQFGDEWKHEVADRLQKEHNREPSRGRRVPSEDGGEKS